jgi:hypothetical protein
MMMKKMRLTAGILGMLAFLMTSPAGAQQQVPPAAPEPQAPPAAPAVPAAPKASKLYNPQAVETITGKVVAVNRLAARIAGRPARVTLMLQTAQGNVKVHLGPADYLDQQALKPAVGDQVEVKGARLLRAKVTTFTAGEVRKGDQVLKLRDDATGRPLWFKGKQRNGSIWPRPGRAVLG